MRHQKSLRKFSRTQGHRRAMFRNMATSLFRHERFETTVEKAKDLRRVVEKLISLGRQDTLAHRRQAYSYLFDKAVVHKLFAEIGPRFKARPGGYTRIVRTQFRRGDAAQLAYIELVTEEYKGKKPARKRAAKPKKEEAAPPVEGAAPETAAGV